MVQNPKDITARQLEGAWCRYAGDLRTFKEQPGGALETVYVEARTPKSVPTDYEASALYYTESFHEIYLCSLTKGSAVAVGLDVDRILSALERALDGSYKGGLMRAGDPEDDGIAEPDDGIAEPEDEQPELNSARMSGPKSGASSPKLEGRTERT